MEKKNSFFSQPLRASKDYGEDGGTSGVIEEKLTNELKKEKQESNQKMPRIANYDLYGK